MLLTLQAVQGWVGPTMAISLVLIASSFLVIASAVLFGALALRKQARRLREQMGGLEADARRSMRSVRRATRNAAEASQVLKEQAYHFAHTGKKVRGRIDDVTDMMHQRAGDSYIDVLSIRLPLLRAVHLLGQGKDAEEVVAGGRDQPVVERLGRLLRLVFTRQHFARTRHHGAPDPLPRA